MGHPSGVTFHAVVATQGSEGARTVRSPTGRAVRLVLLGHAQMAHETIVSVRVLVILQRAGSSRPIEVHAVGLASGSHPSVQATVEVPLAPGDYLVSSPSLSDTFELRIAETGLPQMICSHRRRRPTTCEGRYVFSRQSQALITEQTIDLQSCCRRIQFEPVEGLFWLNVDQVLAGSLHLEVNGVRSVVRAGEYFVTNPRSPAIMFKPGGQSGVRFRHLIVAQPFLRALRDDVGLSRGLGPVDFDLAPRSPGGAVARALALWESAPFSMGEEAFLQAATRALLIALWEEHPSGLKRRLDQGGGGGDDRFQIAMRYLADHCDRRLEVGRVAQESGMSPSGFRAACERHYGLSPQAYLRRLRMDRATALLRRKTMKVEEVARAVGYRDVRAFYRAFREHTQLNPGAYRRTV